MRRPTRILLLLTAAVAAAVTVYVAATLPPRAAATGAHPPATHVVGAYHIHTSRSDGSGSVDDIAAAASRAGLQFVIFTDHGDATRRPDPPAYRHGVLCIDAVEIGTSTGHVAALGLGDAAPFPLGGEARDVIDDVRRLGGWTVAAHPDSPKASLRWPGGPLQTDGLEWINADSEWRDERPAILIRRAAHYLIRPPEAIAALFARPSTSLRRWDQATRQRAIVGLGAVDVHARIGWDEQDEPRVSRTVLARPTYEEMFRTVSQVAVIAAPLSGDAASDARAVTLALRRGETYSVIRGFATPGVLSFSAAAGERAASIGQQLSVASGTVEFVASVAAPKGIRLVLLHQGVEIASSALGELRHIAPAAAGAYRIEAYLAAHDAPWMVSNPVYIRPTAPSPEPPSLSTPGEVTELSRDGWVVERHSASSGELTPDAGALRFQFKLHGGVPGGQFAAATHAIVGGASFDRVRLTARSDRPMRVSLQVRLPGGRDGERWRRSIYLDQSINTITVPLEEFELVGMSTSRRPIVAQVQSVLIVVDTVNTKPGSEGTLWVSSLALLSPSAGAGPPVRR